MIKETLPPTGYMKMDALIPVSFDEDGDVILGAVDSDDVSFDSAAGTICVDNHKIYELPSAGGIGIYIFVFIGSLTMATTVLSYLRRRKVA